MPKRKKSKPAIATDNSGWGTESWLPQPGNCKQCGAAIPRTKKRAAHVYGGFGRARELCSAMCRKRWSRAHAR